MLKKFLAAVGTLLLAAGLSVIAVAGPAAATHPVVTGTAACNPATGQYDITWRVSGDPQYPDATATIKTQSLETTPTLVGQTVKGSQYVEVVQTNVTKNDKYKLGINVQFDTHAAGQLTWQESKDVKATGPCAITPPDDVVDCSAATVYTGEALTNGDHINMTITQYGQQFQTNAQIDIRQAQDPASESGLVVRIHQKSGPDITLPITNAQKASGVFTFTYSAYLTGEWTVNWVQFDTHNKHFEGSLNCGSPVYDAAAAFTVTDATCSAPGQLVLGATSFASWGTPTGAFTVVATAENGHRFAADSTTGVTIGDGGKTKTVVGTIPAQLSGPECIPDPVCLPKSAVSYTYDPATNAGAVKVVNPDPTKYTNELCQGFWVTATSWKFLDDDTIWPQVRDVVQKLGFIHTVGTYPYDPPVVCGQGDIYASFLSEPDPSPYLLGPNKPGTTATTPGGSFVETFLHQMGFSTSTPGNTWTQDAPGCNKVPVVDPIVKKIEECGVYGSIAAVDTAQIDYTITPNNGQSLVNMEGSYTVTAVAIAPAVLDSSYPVGGWVIDLNDYEDCYKPSVTYELGGCYPNGTFSSKNLYFVFNNEGSTVPVTFTVPNAIDVKSPIEPQPSITVTVPAGETVKVETTPTWDQGVSYDVFADGVLLKKIEVPSFEGCLDSKPGDPIATPAGCVAGEATLGNIWVDLQPGLVYTITGVGNPTLITPVTTADNALPAGDYEVTVVALPGYVLSGDTVWPYEITIDPPVNCVKPFAKAELGVKDATCFFDGSIDNSKIVLEHATWDAALPTAPGSYTVMATAEQGYTFEGGATTKSIPVVIDPATDGPECVPVLDLVMPKVDSSPLTCTQNGSYTLGVAADYNPAYITWTVNGVPGVLSGTYPVTSSQVITAVAVPVAPHGLEAAWVNPQPITFTKPSATTCGDLPTLAFTGGMASTGLFTLAGGLIFVGIAGAFVARRRFLADQS